MLTSACSFITYRPAKHLDRKHTIFGKVVGGLDTLTRLENTPTDPSTDRPTDDVGIVDVVVFVDPFEEFQKQRSEREAVEREREAVQRSGGRDDEKTTWTGKRVRGYGGTEDNKRVDDGGGTREHVRIGKYMKSHQEDVAEWAADDDYDDTVGVVEEAPLKKKVKGGGGFGNFDNW